MDRMVRYFISIVGSSLVGFGVGLCVTTSLGADALGVLWEGIAGQLSITVGQASLLITAVCILMVLLIKKDELGLATILNPIATSLCTDLMIRQVDFLNSHFLVKLLIVVVGISFIGIGSGIAAATETGKEGYIALSFALNQRLNIDLAKVRICLDLFCFLAGIILGGHFMLGPVIGIVLIGPILKKTSMYCGKKLQPMMR